MRSRTLLFTAGAALALAALWLLLQPVAAPPAELAARGNAKAEFSLTLRDGAVHGPGQIHAWQGEPVRIDLLSDIDDAAHLHGYELHLELAAGEPGAFEFTAEHSGRFVLELHGDERQIATLEVYPRK